MAETGFERGGDDVFDFRVGHAEDAESKGGDGCAVGGDGLHLENFSLNLPVRRRK